MTPANPSAPASLERGPVLRALRSIIIEPEAACRSFLRSRLEATDQIVVPAEAATVAEARSLLKRCVADVVFLDATLPDGDGLSLVRHLTPGTLVVLLADSAEYAAQAFEIDAVDCLVKPLNQPRFQETLRRLWRRLNWEQRTPAPARLTLEDRVAIKLGLGTVLVRVAEIHCIRADGEYSRIVWNGGHSALMRKPMKQWQVELPEDHFFRTHRDAIVNLAFIERIEQRQVILRDQADWVPVSLRLSGAFHRKLRALCLPATHVRRPEGASH
jgi:two-component system LytT family response regulator